jgi:hypothetical protein
MVPAVLAALLSDSELDESVTQLLRELPLIDIQPGYWERAGSPRAKVLSKGRKARLGDALIAPCCLDEGISLRTRDRDFRAFEEAARLRLLTLQ